MSLEGEGGGSGFNLGALQGYGLALAWEGVVRFFCPRDPPSPPLIPSPGCPIGADPVPRQPLVSLQMQESPEPVEGHDLLSCTSSEPLTL